MVLCVMSTRHNQAAAALHTWPGFLIGVHSSDKPTWVVPLRDVLESSTPRPARTDVDDPDAWLDGYVTGLAMNALGPWPDHQHADTAISTPTDPGWKTIAVTDDKITRSAARFASFFADRPNLGSVDALTAQFADAAALLTDPVSVTTRATDPSWRAGHTAGWYDAYFDRFALTPTAAAGILVRAVKRGRALPATLDAALRALAARDPAEAARVPEPQTTMTDPEQVSAITQALGAGGPDAAHAQAGWLIPDGPETFSERGQGWWDQAEQTGVIRTNGSRPTDVVVEPYAPDPGEPFVWEARIARNGRGAPSAACPALKAEAGGTGRGDAAPLVAEHAPRTWSVTPESGPDPAYNVIPTDTAQALTANPSQAHGHRGTIIEDEPLDLCLTADNTGQRVAATDPAQTASRSAPMTVRRLTPVEAERLQGMPDGWTAHNEFGEPNAPSVRYRGLGNSVTANVTHWLGLRLSWLLTGEVDMPVEFLPDAPTLVAVMDVADEDDLESDED